jgi:hypothetical protein
MSERARLKKKTDRRPLAPGHLNGDRSALVAVRAQFDRRWSLSCRDCGDERKPTDEPPVDKYLGVIRATENLDLANSAPHADKRIIQKGTIRAYPRIVRDSQSLGKVFCRFHAIPKRIFDKTQLGRGSGRMREIVRLLDERECSAVLTLPAQANSLLKKILDFLGIEGLSLRNLCDRRIQENHEQQRGGRDAHRRRSG